MFDWAMASLVEAARDNIGDLSNGNHYSLVIPAILGGAYDPENIRILPLFELVRLSGSLAYQVKYIPDGQQVEIEIID